MLESSSARLEEELVTVPGFARRLGYAGPGPAMSLEDPTSPRALSASAGGAYMTPASLRMWRGRAILHAMAIALDTLAYAKRLREAGFTEQQAEGQAQALAAAISE
jgi:hypothetical protein